MVDTVQRSPINLGRMGPIGIIPPGFMSLLALKQLGQLPGVLSSVVAPVIEMRDWYMTSQRVGTAQLFNSFNNPLITGGIVSGTRGGLTFTVNAQTAAVPNGQFWYCEQMSVAASDAVAGDTLTMAPALINQAANEIMTVGPVVSDIVTARARFFSCKADRGFWALPGDAFGVFVCDALSAAGWVVNLTLRATVLKV